MILPQAYNKFKATLTIHILDAASWWVCCM